VKPDVAAPTAPDRRDGWDAGIKRLNARQRGIASKSIVDVSNAGKIVKTPASPHG